MTADLPDTVPPEGPTHGLVSGHLTRDVTREECPTLPGSLSRGGRVFPVSHSVDYLTATSRIPVSLFNHPWEPVHWLPRDAVVWDPPPEPPDPPRAVPTPVARARMRCTAVQETPADFGEHPSAYTATLRPVSSNALRPYLTDLAFTDTGNPWQVGREYWLDLTPIPEEEPHA